MRGGIWHFVQGQSQPWAFWNNAFTPDECEKIIELGESQDFQKARAGGTVQSIRQSDITFIYPDDSNAWIFQRIANIVASLNERFFRFDLIGLAEGLQFTKYSAPGERYGRHVDNCLDTPVRKLSLTLQLSDSNSYEGGDLCLHLSEESILTKREQGYIAVFPSWTLHEVTPVTKGSRYSLVAWVTGPPFK